jgi:hypothetical protein
MFTLFSLHFYFHVEVKIMTKTVPPIYISVNKNIWDNSAEEVQGTRKVGKHWYMLPTWIYKIFYT